MDNYQIDSYSGAEIEALLGKIDNLGNASQSSAGLMSAADKTKLDGLDSGAQANVLEGVKIAGADLPITEKKVNIPADSSPTSGSNSLVRSGGVFNAIKDFITRSVNDLVNYYTKTEVNNIIGSLTQFHYEIYASTSAVVNPQSNVLYLIGPTGTGSDKYEEYVYSNGWVKIGDTTIDLSGYSTTEQMNAAINNALEDYATKEEVSQLGQKVSELDETTPKEDGGPDTKDELSFVDENDNCIAQFKEGHVKTKEFDSRDSATKTYVNTKVSTDVGAAKVEILGKVAEVDNMENDNKEVAIIDENDNCIAQFKDGHVRTKYFDSRDAQSYKGRGTILDDLDGFSGSGWTISADKKSATTSTENTIVKYSSQHLNAWNFNLSACIVPVGSTFCVGIGKYIDLDSYYYPNSSLFALEYDGESSKLAVYKPSTAGVMTKVSETALQTISLASGGKYWMLVQKKTTGRSVFIVTITDEYGNAETVENIICGTGMSLAGYGWGAPCAFMLSGDSVTVSDFSFGFPVASELRCVMLGHSWIESNTQSTEHQNSFAGLVQTALGGSAYCLNLGRGGFHSPDVVELAYSLIDWFPNAKYALIGIGLNDLRSYVGTASFAQKEIEVEQDLATIQSTLVSAGIIPIFLSLAWTWNSGKPVLDSINPWMKANLLHVVDINKVFEDSSGNLIESAFVADGNHLTVESCAKVFNCINAQATILLNQ